MGVGVRGKIAYLPDFVSLIFFFLLKAWAKLSQQITGSFILLRFFFMIWGFLHEGRCGGAFSYYLK